MTVLAALVATGACGSAALADDPPTGVPLPPPLVGSPVPLFEPDVGSLALRSWRSDRVAGVLWERVRFTFCTSLGAGPFAVAVTESRGWDRHAPRSGPRYVQRGRFAVRLERRYPFGVPQCRELRYSWRPRRVMRLPGARAVDVTIDFPARRGPGWPIVLRAHEAAVR